MALLLPTSACLPDPQRAQSVDLLDRLVAARGLLLEQPPRFDVGCTAVGDVQTRLYGEPGLGDKAAWPRLLDAAYALNAACGESSMLAQPSTGSPAMRAAHDRWQQGIQREIGVACDDLRAAAATLGRTAPC